ncbi:MAG: hypothetical protein HOC74_03885 [Gemmatimonadetes bacterium]|jgi:hypothetical protein|nr:hypothetical protein [Gemmatimonadota bacterium]
MRLAICLLSLLYGCVFTPPQILYQSDLTASSQQAKSEEERYVVEDGGGITYRLEGLRIKVEPMSDEALNGLFPEDSAKGRFSTNPYTYGDWVDPVLGYTPKRFTVFRVSVINDIYAKVLFDPLKPLLYTDRGDVLHSYGIPSFSPHQSFERYYRAIRGQSGNEFYRFDLRMGNVRSSAFLQDQMVFKGESYSGLLTFDPMDEEVKQARLVIEDFVLKFDASDQPLETIDIIFEFDQQIEKRKVSQAEAGAQ